MTDFYASRVLISLWLVHRGVSHRQFTGGQNVIGGANVTMRRKTRPDRPRTTLSTMSRRVLLDLLPKLVVSNAASLLDLPPGGL